MSYSKCVGGERERGDRESVGGCVCVCGIEPVAHEEVQRVTKKML